MGNLCAASNKTEADRILEAKLRAAQKEDDKVKKLLFLGAGGSGKSTLFKQLKVIHGDYEQGTGPGLTEEECRSYKPTVYQNIIGGMKSLVEGCTLEGIDMKVEDELQFVQDDAAVTVELATTIKEIWNDKGIQECWELRGILQIQDSLKYFIKNIDRVAAENYVPTVDDCLHVRSRTTGIVEQRLMIQQHEFLIVDVGGQRNERRKWINVFDGVTGVIYVAALSAYDQVLFEDDDKNRMLESIELFSEVLGWECFQRTDIILFLNKSDLFAEKLQKRSIKEAFPEYTDSDGLRPGSPEDIDNSFQYVKEQFLSKNPNPERRQIFTHMTCATDTNIIRKIFNDVQRIIIDKALRAINLL